MSGPAGCYQKAVEEDDVTALKFGDLGQGEKFLGCLSMDEVRIIQESKINDDENDGVETTTTQTRTFQKTLEFTRRFSTVKTPEQTSMLRDLLWANTPCRCTSTSAPRSVTSSRRMRTRPRRSYRASGRKPRNPAQIASPSPSSHRWWTSRRTFASSTDHKHNS